MVIPAVMFIESAIDVLKTRDANHVGRELKEFDSLGLRLADVQTRIGDLVLSDAQKGYLIGLETARVILAGSALLLKAGIDPEQLL